MNDLQQFLLDNKGCPSTPAATKQLLVKLIELLANQEPVSGGTQLYKHSISLIGAKITDIDSYGTPVIFKQANITIKYIGISNIPIDTIEKFCLLGENFNPTNLNDNMIVIQDMMIDDSDYDDITGMLIYSYNMGNSMHWWSAREEEDYSKSFAIFTNAYEEPELYEIQYISITDTVTPL